MTYARPRVAVMASGGGSTFRATANAIRQGYVDFDVALVISTKEEAGVLAQVEEVNELYGFNIQTEIINKKLYPDGSQGRGQTTAEAKAVLDALEKYRIDHFALMGCMRVIASQVIKAWGWKPEYATQDPEHRGMYLARMSNTHPGILPATVDTYGIHTQERVLELGLEETAHTFHVVATGVDEGPIIAEHRVPAYPAQTYPAELADTPDKLFDRVQRIEKAHLPLDLDWFLKNQARWRSNHVNREDQ